MISIIVKACYFVFFIFIFWNVLKKNFCIMNESYVMNIILYLQGGCIPDAAMIHAARKCRQKARELGTDYIPIEEQR